MRNLILTLVATGSFVIGNAQEQGRQMSGNMPSLNEGISISIVSIEDRKVSADLNINVTFEITNASGEEVYVPNPRVEKGIKFVQPEFFSVVITGADCDQAGFMDIVDRMKGTSEFTRIGPGETIQFSINPRELNLNPDCKFIAGKVQTLQIMYHAPESFFNPSFLDNAYADAPEGVIIMDIYAKVVRGKILSQVVEFAVE